jgi:ribosomal protein S27E
MAIIVCPECYGRVSDRAPSCPHCGFVVSSSTGELLHCGHCEGTGTCTKGFSFWGPRSCPGCLTKADVHQSAEKVVPCSSCGGAGLVRV